MHVTLQWTRLFNQFAVYNSDLSVTLNKDPEQRYHTEFERSLKTSAKKAWYAVTFFCLLTFIVQHHGPDAQR